MQQILIVLKLKFCLFENTENKVSALFGTFGPATFRRHDERT